MDKDCQIDGNITLVVLKEKAILTIEDSNSFRKIVEIELSSQQFYNIFRQMHVDCKIKLQNLDKIGKKLEVKKVVFEISKDDYIEKNNKYVIIQAKSLVTDEWFFDEEPKPVYLNQAGRYFAEINVRRWV
jgi:hypothetical protein